MIQIRFLHHRYYRQELEGRNAKAGAICPYCCSDLGRRCAWLAGYRDNH